MRQHEEFAAALILVVPAIVVGLFVRLILGV
jgi:hypothetical protein